MSHVHGNGRSAVGNHLTDEGSIPSSSTESLRVPSGFALRNPKEPDGFAVVSRVLCSLLQVAGMTTVVLVHGAWHGGWCREHLTPPLERGGLSHVEVELPFTGHLDDVRCVRDTFDGIDGPKVLVGHSYGGLVMSGAADDRDDILHLVHVCAFLFEPGRTAGGELAEAAIDRLRAMDASTTGHECLAEPWRTIPTTCIVCEQNEAISAEAQHRMAARAGRSVSLDTDHSPFLSAIPETAMVIVAASTPT